MYSEIRAAGFNATFDSTTQTHIGYLSEDSADGATRAGTWISFSDKDSFSAIAEYVKSMNLGGLFMFDYSMDTVDYDAGTPTYEIANLLHDAVKAPCR